MRSVKLTRHILGPTYLTSAEIIDYSCCIHVGLQCSTNRKKQLNSWSHAFLSKNGGKIHLYAEVNEHVAVLHRQRRDGIIDQVSIAAQVSHLRISSQSSLRLLYRCHASTCSCLVRRRQPFCLTLQ